MIDTQRNLFVLPLFMPKPLQSSFARQSLLIDHFQVKLDTLLGTFDAFEIEFNIFQIKASFFGITLESRQDLLNNYCSKKIQCDLFDFFLNLAAPKWVNTMLEISFFNGKPEPNAVLKRREAAIIKFIKKGSCRMATA